MRDTFVESAGINNALLGISYDRYSDVYVGPADLPKTPRHGKIRIGLLGPVSEARKVPT